MSMTDNEIIKALECCSGETCLDCSLDGEYIGSVECITELSKEALDLIQRQQERIERLKDNLDAVLSERATLDVDEIVEQLERLPNVNSDYWNFADLIDREDAIDIVKGVQNE